MSQRGGPVKISTTLDYAVDFTTATADLAALERAGLDLIWVAEAYGVDAPSLLGYLAARTTTVELGAGVLPIYTRTPTLLAMTAVGLDALSEGRFHLGLGASGPQVVEGFHGVAFDAPVARTREIVDICREVWRREGPLVHDGRYYQMPLAGGTRYAKALKLLAHPRRAEIPVWLAALGERNVSLAAEVADGWLPLFFIPERAGEVFGHSLAEGASRRDPSRAPLMISAGGLLAIGEGESVRACRERQRPLLAFYLGAMGARGKNFYQDLARRYGFEEAAALVQARYLAGDVRGAEAAVPAAFLEGTTLCGPRAYVAERAAAFREAGVTHLQVQPVPRAGKSAASLIEELGELL